MATKETRRRRGTRRGLELAGRVLAELRTNRVNSNISLEAMGAQLGCSLSSVWRRETNPAGATIVGLSEMASILGYELSVGVHPVGDPIRDKGAQALGWRFHAHLASTWEIINEALLPGPGELRAWDKLLRLRDEQPRHLVGVDLESRIRDVQQLVRRTRLRERDGGVDQILIVLSDSATNRRLVDELRAALGPSYATSPRAILQALRAGRQLPGSGVVLL